MKLFRPLILVQALYSLITGIWPILHIRSFMMVTGPKTDLWLVKTVAALIISSSLTLLAYLKIKSEHWPAAVCGTTMAFGLTVIDIYYSFKDVISPIYLTDAFLELIFIACWIYLWFKGLKEEYK